MRKVKTAYVETQQKIDYGTGEVTEHSRSAFTTKEQEPPYVKLYLSHITSIYELPKNSSPVLLEIAKRIGYDNIICINKFIREAIAKSCGMKEHSIANLMSKYVKADLLQRLGQSTYMLNPNLFAKGAWQDIKLMRAEYLKLTVTYESDGTPVINKNLEPNLRLA